MMTKEQMRRKMLLSGMLLLATLTGLGSFIFRAPLHTALRRVEASIVRQPLARSAGGSFATTDTYLAVLETPRPSEAVLAAFANLPADDDLIFIGAGDDPSRELTYRAIAYLGWPRQIGELVCGATPELLFKPHTFERVRWLMFYKLAPPAALAARAQHIGPHLTIIPITELQAWTSYCSP